MRLFLADTAITATTFIFHGSGRKLRDQSLDDVLHGLDMTLRTPELVVGVRWNEANFYSTLGLPNLEGYLLKRPSTSTSSSSRELKKENQPVTKVFGNSVSVLLWS